MRALLSGTIRQAVGPFGFQEDVPGRCDPKTKRSQEMAKAKRDIGSGRDVFNKGLAVRREVLGAEYVDRSFREADDFTRPMQELTTTYCWGTIWTRPGLSRKTRSFINLAMLTALNRPHEIEIHVRAALNNGLTQNEIREVFLQTAIYCGVPAAIDSFRIAKRIFAERPSGGKRG
jgi:4-carboxymuconolactone decarboxylase